MRTYIETLTANNGRNSQYLQTKKILQYLLQEGEKTIHKKLEVIDWLLTKFVKTMCISQNSVLLSAKFMETNHLQAHIAMLNYLAPKWYGNSSLMHGFANKHYLASDKGILSILPLYAMVEEWLYLGISGEKEKHNDFFKEGYRRTYILQVQAKFLEHTETAVLNPIFYNYLAFLLFLLVKM